MLPRDVIKKVRRIQIRTRHLVNEVFAGQYRSTFKGRGMEFDEVREYIPGDDIRSIDWNVTARMQQPYVKKFVEEREMTVMLLIDISASNRFGSHAMLKKDLAAEISALLAFSATLNNDRVGLILFTEEVETYIPPRKGSSHVLRVIREALFAQPRRKGTKLAPVLDYLNRVMSRRAVCFLVSDFFATDDYTHALRIAARHHDLVAVRIGDRREEAWPKAGVVRWRDEETGRDVVLDTSDPRVRSALTAGQERRQAGLASQFRKAGVDTIGVQTGESYERAFQRFFRERERRRRF